MDLLGLVILIIFSIISGSVKKSNDAKQQRAKRQQAGQSTVYRSQSSSVPSAAQKPASKSTPVSSQSPDSVNDVLDGLSNLFGGLYNMLGMEQQDSEAQPVQSKPKTASAKSGAKKKGGKKATSQTAKKSPSELPKQTLIEQRPDREQREAYTKVAASVKPLKNAFENDERCEHRIELNPNIQYSSQKQTAAGQKVAMVKTDGDSVIQGMIWAEILGKPKAYQRQASRFGRQ